MPAERLSKSGVATATVIWAGAVAVIITDGVEAEGIITDGATIASDFKALPAWRNPGLDA
jgi:hypothetical protein